MPGVVEEYEDRIEGFARRVSEYGLMRIVGEFGGAGGEEGGEASKIKAAKVVPKKRKVVDDDGEEDGDETGDSGVETKRSRKNTGGGRVARRVVETTSDVEDEGPNTLHG